MIINTLILAAMALCCALVPVCVVFSRTETDREAAEALTVTIPQKCHHRAGDDA
ncbi:hypothetical protein ABT255_02885 [Streptomyces mirabilis]|uniref:hypothetical protein n=1 Tax=Streptomyces mirabilis TaxID=68239 RepID=UPI0033327678